MAGLLNYLLGTGTKDIILLGREKDLQKRLQDQQRVDSELQKLTNEKHELEQKILDCQARKVAADAHVATVRGQIESRKRVLEQESQTAGNPLSMIEEQKDEHRVAPVVKKARTK